MSIQAKLTSKAWLMVMEQRPVDQIGNTLERGGATCDTGSVSSRFSFDFVIVGEEGDVFGIRKEVGEYRNGEKFGKSTTYWSKEKG